MLRLAQWISRCWRLVVRYEMAPHCTRLSRPASVAARTVTNPINQGTLLDSEVATWSSRRNQLAGKRARSDADTAELGNARLRLASEVVGSSNFAFDAGPIGTRLRPPVRVNLPHSSDSILCSRLSHSQTRDLPRLRLRYGASPTALRRVLPARFPIIVGSSVRHDTSIVPTPAIRGRPLPAVGITRRHTGLIGIEVRVPQRDAVQDPHVPERERMSERCL